MVYIGVRCRIHLQSLQFLKMLGEPPHRLFLGLYRLYRLPRIRPIDAHAEPMSSALVDRHLMLHLVLPQHRLRQPALFRSHERVLVANRDGERLPDALDILRERQPRRVCGETNIDKRFAAAARRLSRHMDEVLAAPAETCDADGEPRGLGRAELGEKVHDARYGDAEAVLVHEWPEAVDCASDIVPDIDQQGLDR